MYTKSHQHIYTRLSITHTPPRAYFRAKSKRERWREEMFGFGTTAGTCFRWQMVLVEALGERENVWARTNRCWVALARPI